MHESVFVLLTGEATRRAGCIRGAPRAWLVIGLGLRLGGLPSVRLHWSMEASPQNIRKFCTGNLQDAHALYI